MPITLRVVLGAIALAVFGVAGVRVLSGPAHNGVVVGYQTGVDPGKFAQVSGAYERALGQPVIWRKFDSGTDVITALAAGDIDFGDLGSSPLAIAATRQLSFQTVALISRLGRSEALVVRNGAGAAILRPADLIGKRVAVPFVSTCHYSLLAALAHWGIPASAVHIINLSPPQIAAAWARGDIDAAYVWEPALGTLSHSGHVLVGSDDVARWGAPTYEAWVVRRDFAKANPQVVGTFVRVSLDAVRQWQQARGTLTAQSAPIRAVAALTGSSGEAVHALLSGNDYPDAAAQAGPALLGGGLARSLAATANFLKSQGKVDRVLVDYRPWIDARWVRAAAGGKTSR
jgi:taurine transport system substrate-binding protein